MIKTFQNLILLKNVENIGWEHESHHQCRQKDENAVNKYFIGNFFYGHICSQSALMG